jgi:7-keto-8-aminopelargonate synthetase-like enzyme
LGLGLKLGEGKTPVIPVYTKGEKQALTYWRELFDRGVLVLPVIPPAVAPNTAILRVSVTAAHTNEQIDQVLTAFAEASRAVGLI